MVAISEASPDPFYSETRTLKTAEPPRPPAQAVLAEAVSTGLPPPQAGKTFNLEPAGGSCRARSAAATESSASSTSPSR